MSYFTELYFFRNLSPLLLQSFVDAIHCRLTEHAESGAVDDGENTLLAVLVGTVDVPIHRYHAILAGILGDALKPCLD